MSATELAFLDVASRDFRSEISEGINPVHHQPSMSSSGVVSLWA